MKIFIPFALLFAASLLHAADSGGAAPAAVTKEGDLVVVTLKPDAEQKLRLKVVPVEKKRVPGSRLFSGEVVYPLAGEGSGVAPVLGGTLDEVLRLADLQAAADGRILQAKVQIEAAKIALERAQKVLNAEAGSVRSVDEAKTALSLAESALATAKAQRDILGDPVGKPGGSKRAWVRVAIYSGEINLLDATASASIRMLGADAKSQSAEPVTGPPTANALTNTVDWYYQLPADNTLRAGERVAVEISTRGNQEEHLVIPFNAVLNDINGGQWVYVQTAEHTYTRKRIQVARISGAEAVLASGPAVGSKIVTDGSAELFGTEFMTGK
ncbi:efflux RND transporter periplasmic adaptor subunit [Prosthecobacter sp.]|uniref:efflux RND transporter periplasmic adaptor subunit n=1 Tax=Prosthecobacter sp. TaxID=1965333 RepID=UPI0037845B3E